MKPRQHMLFLTVVIQCAVATKALSQSHWETVIYADVNWHYFVGTTPPPANWNEIDLTVVPGLAFDQSGNRIGYGSGYYDRFLPELPSESVGLCFSENFFNILPRAAHDASVKYVITESILHNVVS